MSTKRISSIISLKKFQINFILLSLFITTSGLNISTDYDPYQRPNHGAVADLCNVSLNILTIRDINPHNNMEFTMDIILRKGWTDPRLQNLVKKETIFMNEFPHNIWTPDLNIVNSINLIRSDATNSRTFQLKPEGELVLTERLAAKINCPTMSFSKFPFDKHTCHIKLISYAYNLINLDFVWNGIISQKEIQISDPAYYLISLGQTTSKESMNDRQHRSLLVNVILRRSGSPFMIRVFIPLAIFAAISYLTLFMHVKHAPKQIQNNSEEEPHKSIEETKQLGQINRSETEILFVRLGVNGLMFLLCVLVGQINFISTPGTSSITGLDIWASVINLIILIIFIQSLTMVIRNKRGQAKETQENGTLLTEKFDYCLKVGVPIFFILFVVVFFAVYLT